VLLATPPSDPEGALAWVSKSLSGLWQGPLSVSPGFRGGRSAALAALGTLDLRGYSSRRSQVLPVSTRGASRLSPYIRHGLITLGETWASLQGPSKDVARFADELLWQEYARHRYARHRYARQRYARQRYEQLGSPPGDSDRPIDGTVSNLAGTLPDTEASADTAPGWDPAMRCIGSNLNELVTDGWMVNQARMWLASQWTVRDGLPYRQGEGYFFSHLLDGSRAANRLGWEWTSGAATGRPYGFSRWQVQKRAGELCDDCVYATSCPIQEWPDTSGTVRSPRDPVLSHDPDPMSSGGPTGPEISGHSAPEAVWITAESLGDCDPALSARPDLPAVFVFDDALLRRVGLSAKRLAFLAECLADLTQRRDVEIRRGDPLVELDGRPLAATFTPVPGWRRFSSNLRVVEMYPWPWLAYPVGGPIGSYSSWRRLVTVPRRAGPDETREATGR
jgi:deoxyribodipyrimidine photo-lyase